MAGIVSFYGVPVIVGSAEVVTVCDVVRVSVGAMVLTGGPVSLPVFNPPVSWPVRVGVVIAFRACLLRVYIANGGIPRGPFVLTVRFDCGIAAIVGVVLFGSGIGVCVSA